MRIPTFLTAIALSALVPGALMAHVTLAASTPGAGAEAKAPKAITLTFSAPVAPASAAVSIVMTAMPGMKDHGEMLIRNFTPRWSADGTTMTLALAKPLPAGSYEVRWQAAGGDGHAVRGTLAFDVK